MAEEQKVQDLPKLAIQMATVVGVLVCAALAWQSPVWIGWAFAVALVGVSLSPKPYSHPHRWNMPDALFQAVGLAAVPSGIALAFILDTFWAVPAGLVLMVLCAVVSSELAKPKAAGR